MTKLVLLGDSVVEGRGDPGPGGYRGWAPLFAEHLGIARPDCLNLGAHLATTQTVIDHQLPVAAARRAGLAGVIVGFNDIVGEYDGDTFRRNLELIFTSLGRHATVMFTATYPDVARRLTLDAARRPVMRSRIDDANAALRALSLRHPVVCLDIARSDDWLRPELWADDGLHPGPAGHRLFAEHVAQLVSDAMGIGLTAAAG